MTPGGERGVRTERRPVQGVPQVELLRVSCGNFFELPSHQDVVLCLERKQPEHGPSRDFLLIPQSTWVSMFLSQLQCSPQTLLLHDKPSLVRAGVG